MEEITKCCANCKHMTKACTEAPCCNCYNRFNFKTGDIVISKTKYESSKHLYIYLRNKWVLRVPYYVTTSSSHVAISSTGYRVSEMIDKLIRSPKSECEWLDEGLEYASPEMIIAHDSAAQMVFDCKPFSEWFFEVISEEPKKKESLKDLYKRCFPDPESLTVAIPNYSPFDRVKNSIKNVIFSDPATIIFWEDGTKTVVKTQDGEKYDKEKGFAMAVCKKVFGNERDYYHVFKRWMRKGKEVK